MKGELEFIQAHCDECREPKLLVKLPYPEDFYSADLCLECLKKIVSEFEKVSV